MTIQTISKNCFIINGTIRIAGASTSVRSTIIKENNDITIISPIKFTDDHLIFIKSLGKVSKLIAPNVFHHLYLKNAKNHFPEASVFIPKGLEKKIDLQYLFLEDSSAQWPTSLNIFQLQGAKKINEFIFFHEEDKTLITSDLFFNVQNCQKLYEKLLWSCLGVYKRCAHSRLLRLFLDDKKHFKESKKQLQSLNAKNLILAHGEIILDDHDKIKVCLDS